MANLSKDQIEYIDNRLKVGGLKYWDLRLEFIDHVVNDIENKIENGEAFKNAVHNSLISLGCNGNFKELNRQGWKNTNRDYRKKYHKEFLYFFRKTNNLLLFLTCFSIYFLLSEKLILKNFIKISYLFMIIPILIFLFEAIKVGMKKYGKSVNLDYGLSYFSLAFIILNGIPRLFSSATENTQKTIWLILIPIYFVATYSGYKVFKKAINKVEIMRKELSL